MGNDGLYYERRYPPLLFSLESGDITIIKELLSAGADINNSTGFFESSTYNPPIIYALRSGNLNIIQLMLINGASFNKVDRWLIQDAVLKTVITPEINDVLTVEMEKAKLKPLDNPYGYSLWKSIEDGNDQDFDKYWKLGAGCINQRIKTNYYDGDEGLTLILAIYKKRADLLERILGNSDYVKHVNSPTFCSFTPLMIAIKQGSPECVRLLLKFGAKVNISKKGSPNLTDDKNQCGYTPLLMAAKMGNLEMVQMLLEAAAKPELNPHDMFVSGYLESIIPDDIVQLINSYKVKYTETEHSSNRCLMM